jgi:hypothetical protein
MQLADLTHPAVRVRMAVLRNFRAKHSTADDPFGAGACWKKRVKPLRKEFAHDPDTLNFLTRSCRICGLCKLRL